MTGRPKTSCRSRRGQSSWAIVPVILACLAATQQAAGRDDPELLEEEAFRAAVDRVAPSVVSIETVGGLERVGKMLVGTGPTTGLVVDSQGYVISSALNFLHRPASILVRLPDGKRKPAELVATDRSRMLVLLKIDVDKPLSVPEIVPQSEIRLGQWTIAVGRTFEADRPNMSVGILSAVNRVWGKAIQTDAAVSPNNYGGPLLDISGRVLGVLVPLSPLALKEVAGVEWYDSGIGFAVPAEHLQQVLPRLKKGEDLYPGLIGISFRGRNLSTGEPVIAACRLGGPAYEAGLRTGDRFVEIEGRKIVYAAQVKEEIGRRYAGQTVRVVVLRGEKRVEHTLELAAKLEPYQRPALGILPMRTTGTETADPPEGVTVRYVYPESPAAAAGITPGDVLVSLSGNPLAGRDKLLARISAFRPEDEVELEVRRGPKTLKLKVRLGRPCEDLPPDELPPARPGGKPPLGQRPPVGAVELKIPELDNEAWAYVPDEYDPAIPHGVVIWLHAAGGYDRQELFARWKPHCDRHDLILLAPKSADPARWRAGEVTLLAKLLDEIASSYTVDGARVVAHGQEGGGGLAYLVAFRHRTLVRAVAAVDAPMIGQPPENDPVHRLTFYVATAEKSRFAGLIEATITRLRQMKYPVTVKPLGQQPRYLDPDELTQLVRWIDTLDRI